MDEPRAQAGNSLTVDPAVAQLQSDVAALSEKLSGEVKRIDQAFTLQKEAVGTALVAQEKAVAAALMAADKATEKDQNATREKFSAVNEFRGALDDLSKTMATRREMEDFRKGMDITIDGLKIQTNVLGSRLDRAPELRALEERTSLAQGRSAGLTTGWGLLVGALGLAATVIVVGSFMFGDRKSNNVTTAPQVIYIPAPAQTTAPAMPTK